MKISIKIFFYTYIIMVVVLFLAGFEVLKYLYNTDLDNAFFDAVSDCKSIYNYVWALDNLDDDGRKNNSLIDLYRDLSDNGKSEYYTLDYKAWREETNFKNRIGVAEGEILYTIVDRDNEKYVQSTCRIGEKYIIAYNNIQYVFDRRNQNYLSLKKIIIFISAFMAIVLYIFSWYITRPIVELTKKAKRMSEGDYTSRVQTGYGQMKSIELKTLGDTFNILAENTQKHIEELEENAQKQERFVGSFTHEIKTPLTSIIGYSDLLRTYQLDPEKQHSYSEFIYREGKRLEQLSSNLLQLLVVGKSEFTFNQINMEKFMKDIENSVKFLSEKYSVEFEFSYDAGRCSVEHNILKTAIINLIDNACKASSVGQKIEIKGEVINEKYRISVIDYGIGIAQTQIKKITEPFYMVDKSRARKQGGAGLGLALCKLIAEVHGTTLDIESRLGKGTTMHIDIMLCDEESAYEK